MQFSWHPSVKTFSLAVILFGILFTGVSCSHSDGQKIVNATMNLSGYSFPKGGPVNLSGNWNFRYENDTETFVTIPSSWKGIKINGKKLGAFGSAEYRLRLILPQNAPRLILGIGDIGTASSIYLNGVEVVQTGTMGSNAQTTVPSVKMIYVPVSPQSDFLDIGIKVVNYDDTYGGGIWGRIILGTIAQIEHEKFSGIIGDSFKSGLFFIASLLFLFLFFYRPADLTSLLFGLICFAFFLRQISTGDRIILLLFPDIPWRALVRLEYLSLYSFAPLYVSFFASVYPRDTLRFISKFFVCVGIAGVLGTLFLPLPLMISTLVPFQIFMGVLFCSTLYIIILAVLEKKDDAWIILAGYAVLIVASINDVLRIWLYLPVPSLATIAQCFFIVFQSIALSHRIAREDHFARNLVERNAHLRELDEARMRFFTASSHELRTPVTLITTPLEAIMNGRYGESLPCNAPVFNLIKRNCDRLKHLADELLDFLRFDSGSVQISLRPVDMADYLESYTGLFAPEAQRRGLKIERNLQKDSVALIDPVLFETVVLNLLSNAMKHTPIGGIVTVTLSRSPLHVSFRVSDTGDGMSAEQIPHLFERFTAASSVHGTDYSGFGIGLPLSAEIVKTLGGTISVESRRGEGTTFIVNLPSTDGPGEKIMPPGNRFTDYFPGEKREKNTALIPVLLVDDDMDMLSFLEETLSSQFNVRVASSGEVAIHTIEHGFRPRVIISDVMMPVMDGLQLRERLNKMDACLGVPFLFLSAKSDSGVKKTGLETGAVDYILKPFSIEELSAKIASLASLAQAERERLERRIAQALKNEVVVQKTAASGFDWKPFAVSLGMTERDLEIVACVLQGLSDKEIAAELDCSPRTVSNRVSSLLKRTNTSSRASLIAYISRGGSH